MDDGIERFPVEVDIEVLPGLVETSDRAEFPVLQLDPAPDSVAGRSSRNEEAGPTSSYPLAPVGIGQVEGVDFGHPGRSHHGILRGGPVDLRVERLSRHEDVQVGAALQMCARSAGFPRS